MDRLNLKTLTLLLNYSINFLLSEIIKSMSQTHKNVPEIRT